MCPCAGVVPGGAFLLHGSHAEGLLAVLCPEAQQLLILPLTRPARWVPKGALGSGVYGKRGMNGNVVMHT